MNDKAAVLFLFILIGLTVVLSIYTINKITKARIDLKHKIRSMQNYEDVYVGMNEDNMLDTIGSGYDTSYLKDGRKKYEWRINSTSYGYKGYRVNSGISKLTIYTKDDKVVEIKPYNIDYLYKGIK